MDLKKIYLLFCGLGLILPYARFIAFLQAHGFDAGLLFRQVFEPHGSAFFAWDVVVSALVLVVFIVTESKRLGLKTAWLAIVATFTGGVSLGLPLFLYLRQRKLDSP